MLVTLRGLDSGLGSAVHAASGIRRVTGYGAEVDDVAASALHHAGHYETGHREQAADVGVEHDVPFVEIALMFLVHSEYQSGVVDEHVYVLPFAFQRVEGRYDFLAVTYVERQHECVGPGPGQLGLQGLSLFRFAAVDDDVIAACCELSRAGLADTACGTGDECDFWLLSKILFCQSLYG